MKILLRTSLLLPLLLNSCTAYRSHSQVFELRSQSRSCEPQLRYDLDLDTRRLVLLAAVELEPRRQRCLEETAQEELKNQACAVGGNLIYIKEVSEEVSCPRYEAEIYYLSP